MPGELKLSVESDTCSGAEVCLAPHQVSSTKGPRDFPAIARGALQTVQVNLGYRCNQACAHCHVAAGPKRQEMMNRDTVELVLGFLARSGAAVLDVTGGAPELNPHFRLLTTRARTSGAHVIDRCNLTVLEEPGQADLAEFLAHQQIHVIASLPCYLEDNVDRQRGHGAFSKSIRGLQRLNALGYGKAGTGLLLDLVFNPQGARLPPAQEPLEALYKTELSNRFGIVFNRLLVLVNMPIQRFRRALIAQGEFDHYMTTLRDAYHAENLERVMCRTLISIDWRGYVYDCDFNQMLGLGLGARTGSRTHLREVADEALDGAPIRVGAHCFGCTAGPGSSCGGALSPEFTAGGAVRE